jgi:hypothetical protein
VKDPRKLYNAWQMSQAMRCRPSEIYRLDGLPAYAFDSAVILWGRGFEAALHAAANGAKDAKAAERAQRTVLSRWVPLEAAQYRDPARG